MNIDIEKITETVMGMATQYVPKLALALLVLIIGSMIIGKMTGMLDKVLTKRNFDETLRPFLVNLLRWILKALLFISVASMVGIATTSFVALLGAAGLAVGMALQGSLGNFAGGVLLLIFKPFKVGDYISAQGEEGFVQQISVFATILTTLDNQKIILPNGPLAGGSMKNVTAEPIRRVDLSIGVGYSDDVPKAIKTLTEMCSKHSKVLSEPAPFVGITDYGDSSINLTIRSWCNTADYWDVFFQLNDEIKPHLDAAGISIPFPQRDVHLFNEK